jgi:dTDP-4-amino-4,6-dideoxygalactose transaminase
MHTPTEVVPFLDLIGAHRDLEDELVAAFRRALRSAQFIGGPEVDAFEQEFAAFCGTADCVGVASGTDAVRLALAACGVGASDAVVTVANTFIATVEAITMTGALPEFVDIDGRTCNMSPVELDRYLSACQIDPASGRPIGRRTGRPIRAIVPVHLYGQVADMEPILGIADRYGLEVVEDACQAHGAEYRWSNGLWRRAGSMGHAAAFSFYPSKNLGACGDAGAVTTNDPAVARTLRLLRQHGQTVRDVHEIEGCNSRLDAIQAAFLRVKLRYLEAANVERRIAAESYDAQLKAIPGVAIPRELDRSRGVYHLYVVKHERRDALVRSLELQGIGCGRHYPVPLHLLSCYHHWGYAPGSLPNTESASARSLSLPLFPAMTADQQGRVVGAIAAASSVEVPA